MKMNRTLLFIFVFLVNQHNIVAYCNGLQLRNSAIISRRGSGTFVGASVNPPDAEIGKNGGKVDNFPHKTVPKLVSGVNAWSVNVIKGVLSSFFDDRHFAKFYALETIARVPYFAYVSVLHLKESCGYRQKHLVQLHFSESVNELHHLLIMEELGGDDLFADRFVAQHTAFLYYWFCVTLYLLAPAVAYNLNEFIERHAFETYTEFLRTHGHELRQLPAPSCTADYLASRPAPVSASASDSEQSGVVGTCVSDPESMSLFDVFVCIADDEKAHAHEMSALQCDGEARSK